MHLIKYAILYHLDIFLISLFVSLVLIFPAYQTGVRVLPTTFITKVIVSAGVAYLHHLRTGAVSIYFMNLNFDIKHIQITYLILDVILFLALSILAILLG